jgi:myo-inositol 2-dehydrogenase/D-chiro-inositol 1-dehydrogenase
MGAFHARTLRDLPGVERVTVADHLPEHARVVADELGVEHAVDGDALVAAGIDALVIAAATPAHAPLIEIGAAAGLATFCEKPISLDLPTTDRVLAAVDAAGIELQMGFQRRFDAGFVAARDLLASGGLGTLHLARLCTHDPAPPSAQYIAGSGGIFRDCLIHDFDVLRFVTGDEVVDLQATGSVLIEPECERHDDVDCAAVTARMRSGAVVVLTATRQNGAGYDVRMELTGSRDNVAVGLDPRLPLRSLEPGMPGASPDRYVGFLERFADAYRAEMAAFLQLVRGEVDNPCTGQDARAALVIAEAADLSRRESRTVRIDEVAGAAQGVA